MRHDATKHYVTRPAMTKYLIVSAFPCEVLLRLTFQYTRTLIYWHYEQTFESTILTKKFISSATILSGSKFFTEEVKLLCGFNTCKLSKKTLFDIAYD